MSLVQVDFKPIWMMLKLQIYIVCRFSGIGILSIGVFGKIGIGNAV